jgi:hypothetical protein
MSDAIDIVLADGQATPVNHTFEPTRVSPDVVFYHDKATGVILGYPQVSLGNRLPAKANGNYKATIKVRIPVLETAATAASGYTPGPKEAYYLAFNGDFTIPERATAEEKADLYAFAVGLIASSAVDALVNDMDLPH